MYLFVQIILKKQKRTSDFLILDNNFNLSM